MWSEFTDKTGVGDVLAPVGWDVYVEDWHECVSTSNMLVVRVDWVLADTLAELSKFVGIGGVPGSFVLGMRSQVAVFKHVARGCIQDGICYGRGRSL